MAQPSFSVRHHAAWVKCPIWDESSPSGAQINSRSHHASKTCSGACGQPFPPSFIIEFSPTNGSFECSKPHFAANSSAYRAALAASSLSHSSNRDIVCIQPIATLDPRRSTGRRTRRWKEAASGRTLVASSSSSSSTTQVAV